MGVSGGGGAGSLVRRHSPVEAESRGEENAGQRARISATSRCVTGWPFTMRGANCGRREEGEDGEPRQLPLQNCTADSRVQARRRGDSKQANAPPGASQAETPQPASARAPAAAAAPDQAQTRTLPAQARTRADIRDHVRLSRWAPARAGPWAEASPEGIVGGNPFRAGRPFPFPCQRVQRRGCRRKPPRCGCDLRATNRTTGACASAQRVRTARSGAGTAEQTWRHETASSPCPPAPCRFALRARSHAVRRPMGPANAS